MFQWDAVDISRDLLGQNVLKIFELATRHNKRTTRMELKREIVFVDGIILTYTERYIPDSLILSDCLAHKMAAKTRWHTHRTILRHCHPMYIRIRRI